MAHQSALSVKRWKSVRIRFMRCCNETGFWMDMSQTIFWESFRFNQSPWLWVLRTHAISGFFVTLIALFFIFVGWYISLDCCHSEAYASLWLLHFSLSRLSQWLHTTTQFKWTEWEIGLRCYLYVWWVVRNAASWEPIIYPKDTYKLPLSQSHLSWSIA